MATAISRNLHATHCVLQKVNRYQYSATPRPSFRSVRRRHLFTTCRSQRRDAGKRYGHARARMRARETAFFFFTNKRLRRSANASKRRHCTPYRDPRNCQSLNVIRLYPRTGNRRDERRARKRERESVYRQDCNSRRSDLNCSANATPTPGNQSALSPHAETTNRSPRLLPPLVHSCAWHDNNTLLGNSHTDRPAIRKEF